MDNYRIRRRVEERAELLSDHFTKVVFQIFGLALGNIENGIIRIILPNGHSHEFGSGTSEMLVAVNIISVKTLWRSLTRGSIGFAESYIKGEWETDDLAGLFRIFLLNSHLLRGGRCIFRRRFADKLFHMLRRNTRHGSRKNIAHHYDLGNSFYRAWLDKSMTYSSALFDSGTGDLDSAQVAKFQKIIKLLELTSKDKLLEIGCGWGGFAKYAVENKGARVEGITISNAQHEYANSMVKNNKLENMCEFRLQDYRDVQGRYDKIVSIEMLEAVGKENWKQYFSVLYDRLAENGTAVIQAITICEDWYEDYCRRPDFIQRFIFPGGFLPTSRAIMDNASSVGFSIDNPINFGDSYSITLWHWRDRFLTAWPTLYQSGFDKNFKRMWNYYLTYCAAGFEYGCINVGLYRLTK